MMCGSPRSKYHVLSEHLRALKSEQWSAQFSDIEEVLGFALPVSASTYQAWWANQSDPGHSQCNAWMSVGWRTQDVSISNQRVTFVRPNMPTNGAAATRDLDRQKTSDGLTITQAKNGLAAHYGVSIDSIEITIRG
jgi:hypothetical protein